MIQQKTDTQTLVSALRTLAQDIQSDDGVANACISEAADRIEGLETKITGVEKIARGLIAAIESLPDQQTAMGKALKAEEIRLRLENLEKKSEVKDDPR